MGMSDNAVKALQSFTPTLASTGEISWLSDGHKIVAEVGDIIGSARYYEGSYDEPPSWDIDVDYVDIIVYCDDDSDYFTVEDGALLSAEIDRVGVFDDYIENYLKEESAL